MFTGIIEAVGTIKEVEVIGSDKRLTIETGLLDLSDVNVGDSINVNGVCLTAVDMDKSGFITDVSTETLSCTTFHALENGSRVNLEKALLVSDRLSGHIVSGHVDDIGKILKCDEDARSFRFLISVPESIKQYLCTKGSICVDGVSLTINEVNKNNFSVNIIPHTMQQTIFINYNIDTQVNLEVDIIARYLEGLSRP